MRLHALGAVVVLVVSAALAARQLPSEQALERYRRGDHAAAVESIATGKSDAALVALVERTGGAVPSTTVRAVRSAWRKRWRAFRSSYALHYTPKDVDRGGWHEIKVLLPNHPGVEIHARKGYAATPRTPNSQFPTPDPS